MQLHADLCADFSDCLILITETVIYKKLLIKASETSIIVNLNACVTFIIKNSSDYLSFDLYLISIYMNNQLCYYHMISVILDVNKAAVKNQLKNCKASLKLIN